MDWYESHEDLTYDEEAEKKKLYETEKTRNMESEIEQKLMKNGPRQNL